jgi:hydrophobic/amphiphilic exporter-1 (mainly G- bacteria), HAE1 family
MSITAISVKRPLLIIVIFTVLIAFGAACYFHLSYNLLPRIQINTISVSTIYKGASASEVEATVTKKLEDAFSSVEGLDKLSSTSQQGISLITVRLKSNADVDKAERDIQRKADQTQNDLPDDAKKPVVDKISLDDAPVISAGVTSKLESRALYDLIDKQLKAILQNVRGVGQVNIIGGDERQIKVNIDQDKLKAYGLGIQQVTQAIGNANQTSPAGTLETRDQQLSILFDASLTGIDQFKNLIISHDSQGGTIYLREIADVMDGTAKPTAINHINGVPSIGIQIIKQTDANAVDVSKLTRASFAAIEHQYAKEGVQFSISRDQSTYTLASADAVMKDLGLAVLIVGFVMLAFLHSFRSSMFILIALPSSIIPTFIGMYAMGFSLNLMTLMALSLVVGILVDDSIVVLENIYRHLEMGSDRVKASLDGRSEIGFTALAITMVDVVVFLPLAFTGGLIGEILREFALVVVISTVMSLFVSFTVTPMLASRFGKIERLDPKSLWGKMNLGIEHAIGHVKEGYGKALTAVLQKKRWLLSMVIVLIIGSFLLIAKGFIGSTFIPDGDQGTLIVKLEGAPSASLYQTNLLTRQAEQLLLSRQEVTNVFSSIGFVTGSVAGTSNNANLSELTVSLTDKKNRKISTQAFGLAMQKMLSATIAGVKVSFSTVAVSGGSNDAPIQISIKGEDLTSVRMLATAYKKIVASVPGTQYVELSVKDQKPDVAVMLDRDKMTILGVDAAQVGAALDNSFSGNDKSKFRQAGNDYDIMVGLDNHDRTTIGDVSRLSFINSNGQSVELSQFATVRAALGESVLQRSDRINAITVNANVIGRPVGSVAADVKARLAKVSLPDGLSIEYLGDVKNQSDAFGSLGLALLTAVMLVYLIMVALYESLIYPFVVLFSIPVALIGALLALALSMETLNIFSIIGIIMLLGLVSKNAILIVDFTNQLKSEGHSAKDALIEAGKERLRPILMTTLAMILGMLPIAMASGAGSEIKNGMAWVIIGGLTSSMVLTLFVVPSMYLVIENLITKFRKKPQLALIAV